MFHSASRSHSPCQPDAAPTRMVRQQVKELIRKKGAELFRAQLATWMVKLKKEYAISLIKPQVFPA